MTPETTTLIPTAKTTTSRWEIDATHTIVEFQVRHMFTRFRGRFRTVRGTIERDDADVTRSRVVAEVEAASVDTDLAARDEHLRSADFFDVANHPLLRFESRRFEPAGDGRYRMIGDLSIRGVTREVAFDVTFDGEGPDAWGGVRAGATAQARIDRKDFGLEWNALIEAGGVVLGDEVTIRLDVEAILATAA